MYASYADPRLRTLALGVLDHRKARKAVTTYIDPIVTDAEARVHPSWHCYGTVSGRFSCRKPNLMNLHRAANDPAKEVGGIRSLYVAPKGHLLVQFDLSQLEMRIAAYVSQDEVMISACETSDLHAANAEILWGDEFTGGAPAHKKMLRDVAKQAGFAVAYLAGAPTVHARIISYGIPMSLSQVEAMLKKMHRKFWRYYQFQDKLFHDTMRLGYVETPLLGRRRRVGFRTNPSEIANTPIQGGAADLMNIKLPQVVDALPPDVRLIAQIHDAGMFEAPLKRVDETKAIIEEVLARPIEVKSRKVVFPIDLKVGERWSEL
jgi:DNA polymerase I-like protein with 3'-5' exonuclease and polymerase domains